MASDRIDVTMKVDKPWTNDHTSDINDICPIGNLDILFSTNHTAVVYSQICYPILTGCGIDNAATC